MPETTDYAEECDYYSLRSRISEVLRRYYKIDYHCDIDEAGNQVYDDYQAEQALEDIKDIIGEL